MKHNIFGVHTDQTVNFADKFDCIYEDCGAYYETKETYQHREDGLNFDYKYCVEIIDFEECCGGEEMHNKYGIELTLVPVFKSLCKEKQTSVMECCGVEEDAVNSMDIRQYGLGVQVGYEEVVASANDLSSGCFEESDKFKERLTDIASVFETIDALRGFYLDKTMNLIGTTGWDLLNDCINGKDFIKATLAKYE